MVLRRRKLDIYKYLSGLLLQLRLFIFSFIIRACIANKPGHCV